MGEARVDQVRALAFFWLHAAGQNGKCMFGLFRAGEDVRGTAKHGRPRGPERKMRVEAARQHRGARTHSRVRTVRVWHNRSYPECTAAHPCQMVSKRPANPPAFGLK